MPLNIDAEYNLTDEGSWFQFDDAKFKIAHTSNLRFQRALNRLQQPYRRKIDNGTIDPKISRDLMCRAMAEGLVLDWENIIDNSGKPVPYSVEAGVKLLTGNAACRDAISEFALNIENFRKDLTEDLGKG